MFLLDALDQKRTWTITEEEKKNLSVWSLTDALRKMEMFENKILSFGFFGYKAEVVKCQFSSYDLGWKS